MPSAGLFPFRSDKLPRGLANLRARTREHTEADTEMADQAALECIEGAESGGFISVEHPKRFIASGSRSWLALAEAPGLIAVEYHACMSPPCRSEESRSSTRT